MSDSETGGFHMNSIHAGRGGRGPARMRAVLAATAVLAAVPALAPGAAHAGSYPMYACAVPGINLPAPSRGPWVNWNTSHQIQQWDECVDRTRGGSIFFQINYPTGVLAQNTGIGVELTVPSTGPKSAISIADVTDWSSTALTAQGPNQPPALGVNLAPSISTPPGGNADGFDGNGTNGAGHSSGPLATGTKTWRLGVTCQFVGAAKGHCTLPSPFLRVRGIKTTLRELVQPGIAIDGGALLGAGPMRGTNSVAYTAGDDESGVERVEVLLDGTVVATDSFARDLTQPVAAQTGYCTYVDFQACPSTHSGLVDVDTTKVPDGAYELGVRVTDAAGNKRTAVAATPVVIDNVVDQPTPSGPTPIPVPGAPGPAGPGGPGGPSGPGGPAGAAGGVLTLNGRDAAAGASMRATFAASGRGTLTSRYGRTVLVTGRLVAPSGRPIVGARLSVLQQDKLAGAKMTPAGEVVTGADGRFVYTTKAVRSRTIRFGYRAHLEDTDFTSTTDIGLAVIAKLTLSTDRRSLRNGQAVMFRGSVASAPANVRKVIELQVKKGSRWMTFRSTRLRKGRFSERYRFTRTRGRVTYVFRARVRQEVGFPFLTSHSPAVKVTVRG